jgi:hypothetical protein
MLCHFLTLWIYVHRSVVTALQLSRCLWRYHWFGLAWLWRLLWRAAPGAVISCCGSGLQPSYQQPFKTTNRRARWLTLGPRPHWWWWWVLTVIRIFDRKTFFSSLSTRYMKWMLMGRSHLFVYFNSQTIRQTSLELGRRALNKELIEDFNFDIYWSIITPYNIMEESFSLLQ